MAKIKLDKRNYRIHPEENKELIKSSLENYGLGRSILVDGEDTIIAGNGVYEEAEKLGVPVKVIETDGKELIVVKRTDLKTEDRKRKLLAIADNKTTDTSVFDFALIKEDLEDDELNELGFDSYDFLEEIEDENNYTRKVETPTYEPRGEKPEVNVLFDSEKYKELIEKIEKSKVSSDVKDFLKVAASRHIVFDYSNIADFYAHSGKDTQELMEESALIIIDFNKAIEGGFVRLADEITEQFKEDYNED